MKQWFDMSNADMRITRSLYLVVLRKDLPSPLAKESDEEKGVQKEEKPKEAKPARCRALLHRLRRHSEPDPGICRFPAGDYSSLQAGAAGQIYLS